MPTSPDEPTDPATSRPTPPSAPPDAYPFYVGDLKRAMRQHHADLGAQVQSTLDDLTARWQPVQATLANTIQRLRRQMEAAQAQGDHVTYAWLAQAERLAELKASVAGNVGKFAEGARQIIGEGQEGAITLGAQVAQEALAATVPAGMNMVFGVPPDDVTDALAGALQPGTPLSNLFDGFGSTAAQFAEQALFTSVALGEGPAQAAQRLTWATNMSAQRAEVIARTELARSWRSAQMANYRANSDVVSQWQWSADFGPRCCGACMALDGTIHELSEEMDDHICGRCSALPITRSWADILGDAGIDASNVSGLGGAGGMASLEETSLAAQRGGVNGREWFAKQSAEMQNAILGPAKAEAYRAGDLTLEQLVDYSYSPEWGWSLREASLADLGLDAHAYLGAARGNGTADLASLREQRAATERIVREIGAAERARAQEIKAAADEWYAGVERAIGRSASGSPEQLAEAKAAADEWYAQIEQSIARGQVAPGAYDRSWDIRREEAIAVAEGRASFLPQSVAGEAVADAGAEATAVEAPPTDVPEATGSSDALEQQARDLLRQADEAETAEALGHAADVDYAELREQAVAAQAQADVARGGVGAELHVDRWISNQGTAEQPHLVTEDVHSAINKVFRRDVSRDDLAHLVGAGTGDDVQIRFGNNGAASFEYEVSKADGTHTSGEFYRIGKNVYLEYGEVAVPVGERSLASGQYILESLDYLRQAGITKLSAFAAGSGNDINGAYRGFYTWARLGFTGKIPDEVLDDVQAQFGRGVKTIQALMAQPGGPAWWKVHGVGWDATFDFREGSLSRQILDGKMQRLRERQQRG